MKSLYNIHYINVNLIYTVSHELLYLNSVLFSFSPHTFSFAVPLLSHPFLLFLPPPSLHPHPFHWPPLSFPLSCPLFSVLAYPPPPSTPLSMVVADSDFASKMKNRQMGSSGGINMTKSTSISGDMCNLEKTDGSQSDTAVGTVGTDDKKRRSSIGAKMQAMVGMSRKSRSTSQLSQTGRTSSHAAGVLSVFSVQCCICPPASRCLCVDFSVFLCSFFKY